MPKEYLQQLAYSLETGDVDPFPVTILLSGIIVQGIAVSASQAEQARKNTLGMPILLDDLMINPKPDTLFMINVDVRHSARRGDKDIEYLNYPVFYVCISDISGWSGFYEKLDA